MTSAAELDRKLLFSKETLLVVQRGRLVMSASIGIQTKRYGAITTIEVSYNGCFTACLIKEASNFVDYSRQRVFQNLDSALKFYFTQLEPEEKSGVLTLH